MRVARVFEAFSTAYMVMDFEQGHNLDTWLRGLKRPPTQRELDRIATPLLDALEKMHAAHFLHRDIAPDNIIVRPDGTPVLLDFGAARRAIAERSRALTGIVKAGYSPFEQYATDSRLQGPWSDIYAFGATLYRAVIGAAPEEATLRVADDRIRPARTAAAGGYRRGFLDAIDACLITRHTDRPQSVAQLRPLLLGETSTRLMPSARRPAAKPAIPGAVGTSVSAFAAVRRLLVAVSVTLLVLGGGLYAGLNYSRQQQEERDRKAAAMAEEIRRLARERETKEAARRKAEADAAAEAARKRSENPVPVPAAAPPTKEVMPWGFGADPPTKAVPKEDLKSLPKDAPKTVPKDSMPWGFGNE